MNTELTIEGANGAGANYIAWAPVAGKVKLVQPPAGVNFVDVTLRNRNTAQGGQVVFYETFPAANNPPAPKARLDLRLPADGTSVSFFVGGKLGRPSIADKDAIIEVADKSTGTVLSTTALMVRIRKNANTLTADERDRFLDALRTLNGGGMGKFSDFRNVHRSFGTNEAHFNFGFLPWHRAFLLDLERELQAIDPSVALPYWRFDLTARNVFTRAFMGASVNGRATFDPGHPLETWATDGTPGIMRSPLFNTNNSSAFVITEAQTLALGGPGFLYLTFRSMEGAPHGDAHTSFSGDISDIDTAAKDPLFFMLHANVDRLWAKWQQKNKRFDVTDTATYTHLGKSGDPGSIRVGHNLKDTMWPWNGITGNGSTNQRPTTAPGGSFPPSAVAGAPGTKPTVGSMVDYQGILNPASRLGFGYDDVGFP